MRDCRAEGVQGMKDKKSYMPKTSPSVLVPSPLFADLDGATIALIVAQLTEEVWPAGHILFEELVPGDTLYIIMDGRVQISRTFQDGERRVIREMGPGEFFGEMALLEDKPRSARASTMTPTTFLTVTRQRFNTLIEQHPAVAINFLKAISAQLRQQYREQAVLLEEKQTLVEALAAKNAALEQALATVAEHERVKRDLEIAHEIQQQMLPATFPQAPGLRLHATTIPATWVGGDLYDAIGLETDRVGLLLGDVSGKGIPAAMQMARLMGEFRACV